MIAPFALVVLAAPPPPVPITVEVVGPEAPATDGAYLTNVLDALAPAGLGALPGCQRASAGVVGTTGCAGSATARVCAAITVKGHGAAECAYELVSAPWPRAIVYAAAGGPAAALVWRASPPVATFLVAGRSNGGRFADMIKALVPVGIDALPACRQVAYDVDPVGNEAAVTIIGSNAERCGAELVSAPWPMPADAVELNWTTMTHETPTTTSWPTDGPVFASESGAGAPGAPGASP